LCDSILPEHTHYLALPVSPRRRQTKSGQFRLLPGPLQVTRIGHHQVNDCFSRDGVAILVAHVGLEFHGIASHQRVMDIAENHFERAAGHNQIFDGAHLMGFRALAR